MKKRALISVSDKNGIVEFAKELEGLGYEIVSTGGTHKVLEENGVKVINISDITGFPECLDGRVKTLHPNVHAGLLAMRSNPEHMAQLEKLGINTIDIVVVNLYPFKKTISKENVEFQDAVENIDIGGPTMLRAAAKNFQDVVVLTDPKDYKKVLDELKENGDVSLDLKKYLMYKVFAHTAVYDSLISNFLAEKLNIEFPETITLPYFKKQDMRYGENPHQKGCFYADEMPKKTSLTEAKQLHGKELSYNNINDTNGALELLREYDSPCVVAVKHANPCGVGLGKDIHEAYLNAYNADPISIFGGIIAINGIVDRTTAEEINKIFVEIVIAKGFDKDAFDILAQKPNIRLLELSTINGERNGFIDMKKVYGGMLMQEGDISLFNEEDVKVVTKRAPSKEEMEQLKFCWKVVKHTKSNAIVIGKNFMTTGIGAGQTNRIWATNQAIEHAGDKAKGSVMASDAFFPFPDCVEAAAKAGITAIIQPGGSIKDQLSIDECDKNNIAMIFVGQRHFKH